jgi:tetratricopeptide (TPR) repeat protein
MTANHTLGEIYQHMNDYKIAQLFHERHEEIANSVDDAEEIVKSNIQLHSVYLYSANQLEKDNMLNEALEMYHRCLGASIKCMDLAAQGEANGKIGNLLLRRGEPAAALPFLRQHSQISADIGDTEGRCRASSALAWALDSLGENAKALTELSLVHSISEQAGDAYLQSQACRALGTMYSKVGHLKEAVDVLQRHFELLKAIINQQLSALNNPHSNNNNNNNNNNEHTSKTPTVTIQNLELARIYVGISKGNLLMESYMHAINFDMSSLLDWKLNRTELSKSNVASTGQNKTSSTHQS